MTQPPQEAFSEQGQDISGYTKYVFVNLTARSSSFPRVCLDVGAVFTLLGAGLQVSFFCSFLLRQSPRWCTNLQCLCASLLTSSFPFSFPFAVVCPEKEVEFQRAPNGEPCLPTHPPTPCCLCPPASHANPFCHVRVLHSSSLHVCAGWAGVAYPARRGPLSKVS